jgi:hypothetical protein
VIQFATFIANITPKRAPVQALAQKKHHYGFSFLADQDFFLYKKMHMANEGCYTKREK